MKFTFSAARPRLIKWAVGLFWCWNVIFICSTLPLIPALPSLFKAWWFDDVPVGYVSMLLVWMLVPWGCVVLARTRLRERPETLVFLFFAVEGPFYSLCLYRLIILRELTPAVSQWLLVALVGLCIYGAESIVRPLPKTRAWQVLRLMALAGLALFGAYVGALVVLAWSPQLLRGLWEIVNPANWLHILDLLKTSPAFFMVLPMIGVILIFVVGSLLAMPLCLMLLCWQAFVRAWRDGGLLPVQRMAAVAAMLVLQGLVFVALNHQPQREAFAVLSSSSLTPAQFGEKQEEVRSGLLNAYLAAYRYASSSKESNSLKQMYESLLGLPPDLAALPQVAFNALATPLLYDGDDRQEDARRAAELYEQYFDKSIQRGERAAIAKALSATYNGDEREAGLINIDQRKVRVAEQRVRIQTLGEKGDLASVTLDETYVNLTPQPQEIFYLFSLPESAAITGLWLGNSPGKMLPHTIATRGAAQKVYKAEVKRRIDPALLEQVGPRQYRLRAFPVPPNSRARGGNRQDADAKLYLRLQYTALARHKAWPLPVLAEKRNVGWDRQTLRSCDGVSCPGDLSTWWPSELPIQKPVLPARHSFTLNASGHAYVAQAASSPVPVVSGKKVTLVVDQSYSMAAHRDELLDTLHKARQQLVGNAVQVLLTTTLVMHKAPVLVPLAEFTDDMLSGFMGGGSVDGLLEQAVQHVVEPQDLTVLISDDGAFDLQANKTRTRIKGGMLSVVHLGGTLAPAYDDATLENIQTSGGSAFASLDEAWQHFALKQDAAPGFLMRRDGYDFSLGGQTSENEEIAFAPLAARLFIASASRQSNPLGVDQLSGLHALAQRYNVITPYSSMLVLVNTQQQDALAEAETRNDRFERAQEQGTEVLQKPGNPLSASITPEPEEWLLLMVSLGVLGWMLWRRWQYGVTGGAAA